jgi:cold shock CspA family protein
MTVGSRINTMSEQSVTVGTVWRWKPRNGTGVIELADGTLAWFHFSAFDDETVLSVTEGMPVDVDVDHTPQGDFTCRAARIIRSLPSSWQH